jgi:hypothetical protein
MERDLAETIDALAAALRRMLAASGTSWVTLVEPLAELDGRRRGVVDPEIAEALDGLASSLWNLLVADARAHEVGWSALEGLREVRALVAPSSERLLFLVVSRNVAPASRAHRGAPRVPYDVDGNVILAMFGNRPRPLRRTGRHHGIG